MKNITMYADKVYRNGKVITVDPQDSICEVIATRGKYIV